MGRALLIVEDDEDSADLLSFFLASKGHDVRVASDAELALSMIREARPDVALIDFQLAKGKSGNELAVEIRREFGDAIRLIATTGHAGIEHRERAMSAGFGLVIVKPFDLQALLRTVDEPSATTSGS